MATQNKPKKLATLAQELYQKYLPLAEQLQIRLDFDLSDPHTTTSDATELTQHLSQYLNSALDRSAKGNISLTLTNGKIIIRDDGTVLSKTAKDLIERDNVQVKSRLGFGTTIAIDLASKSSTKK